MNTAQLIEQALQSKRMHSGLDSKSDWSQFASHNGIEVEVFTNSIVDDKAREQGFVSEYKVVTTRFYRGSRRISRATAEALLSPTFERVDESEHMDSVTGDFNN